MATKRCTQGHHYDPAKHLSCPLCSKVGFDTPRTEMAPASAPPTPPAMPNRIGAETVAVFQKSTGSDPVVGWLVCTKGPARGRDFRLHSEKNFIGRAPTMDVCIANDESVSREKHAIVSFGPKGDIFKVLPGESRGLVYLNGEEVDAPKLLTKGDKLELGETELLFVPLCGKEFKWQ